MYSPAALPSRLRAAPAKKRRLSAMTGISSFVAFSIGLPAFSASSRASSFPCSSIRSASASSAAERCAGVVFDHPSNARRAAITALSTSSGVEIGARAISSPVAGFSTASVSPWGATLSPSMKFLSVSVVVAIANLLVLFVVVSSSWPLPGPCGLFLSARVHALPAIPSASATAGWVISPLSTFNPMRRLGLSSRASSMPRSARSIT